MESHLKSQFPHAPHGGEQGELARRLAATEDDAIEEAVASLQKILDALPGDDAGDPRIDDRVIMTVRTGPRAALSEDRCHECSRPVNARHRGESRDLKVIRTIRSREVRPLMGGVARRHLHFRHQAPPLLQSSLVPQGANSVSYSCT